MHSQKLNELNIVNVASDNDQTPSSNSSQSTPYDALSPTQSVTDSSYFDLFDTCTVDDYDTSKNDPLIQYKINVKPISIPKLLPNISSSMSSTFSSIPSSNSTISDTLASSSSPCSSMTIPSYPSSIEPMNTIEFDIDCGQYMISSQGLSSGYYEWTFRVLKSDAHRQELGVVSVFDPTINITEYDGIRNNKSFGARVIYGIIPEIKSFYYVSYNKDNSCRCNKRLSSYSSWTDDDEIKVCLDNGTITFMLNDKKIRKSISLQRNVTYYPIISFSDNCYYQVIG